ncbi:hypothetical protein N5P32_14015 [Marinomonas pontica]|nr:hypothetical protein [Marinomonas pontica]
MFQFIFRRLSLVIPTFIGITLLTFTLIRLIPGDPIEVMAGERGVSDERHAELSAQLGFDQPLYVQYFRYVSGVLQGDLGNSLITREPVMKRIPNPISCDHRISLLCRYFRDFDWFARGYFCGGKTRNRD